MDHYAGCFTMDPDRGFFTMDPYKGFLTMDPHIRFFTMDLMTVSRFGTIRCTAPRRELNFGADETDKSVTTTGESNRSRISEHMI